MLVKFYSENGMLMFVLADAQIAKKVQPAIYISKADTTKKKCIERNRTIKILGRIRSELQEVEFYITC